MATSAVYPNFILNVHNKLIDWDTDTFHLLLLDNTYTPDYTTDSFWDDISAAEITGTGYTAGGVTISDSTIAFDGTDTITLDLTDVSWGPGATFDAYHAIVVDWSPSTDATRPLCLHVDFGGAMSPADGSLNVVWNASGVIAYGLTL